MINIVGKFRDEKLQYDIKKGWKNWININIL